MQKTILITGATDGIGFETAKMLVKQGHHVLLHGRNSNKLAEVERNLALLSNSVQTESYIADLSSIKEVNALADMLKHKHQHIDVLINNAGVYSADNHRSSDNLDIRFAVNTIAPYILTNALLPIMNKQSRVLNLSSAAQSTVNLNAMAGKEVLSDGEAYAQSKLALTIFSRVLGMQLKMSGPAIIAINPKSLLASKMVKNAFGIVGNDLSLGAEVLCQASLCDEFTHASGLYFDNDKEKFADPHPDALDPAICESVMKAITETIARVG
ncbi:oxidoreductase [Psychromonas sp. psych-6C06]|uniref:SDR family NAD(P)-dependent oxidoreductase n=1 Tax=Psychromonas sp. psych-6C06 TaxID=2058089 RepID=UPI000C34BBCD|nr:SDR family NAD(P)-dependent oxidoreductase [Psychromonas sp. psych-6C06]PKF61678.1 oxidoreductase [Psychromonas sp. psych-6C06]